MSQSRTQRILATLARLGAAAALVAVAAMLLLILFAGSLVDFVLARVSTTFNGDLRVADAALGIDGIHFKELQLTDAQGHPVLTAPRGTLGIHPFRYLVRRHWMALLGHLSLEEPALMVEVDPEGRLNLQKLWPAPKAGAKPVLAEYTGTLTVSDGWIQYRDDRETGFLYQLRDWDGTAAFVRDEDAVLDLTWVPDQATPGKLHLAGTYNPAFPRFDLELVADELRVFPLAQHPEIRRRLSVHEGRLDGSLWMEANADTWDDLAEELTYGGRLALKEGEVRVPQIPFPVRRVAAKLEILNGMLQVEDATGILNGMGFTARGRFLFPPNAWLDLAVVVPRLQPSRLAAMLDRKIPVGGNVRADIAISGPPGGLGVRGLLEADRLEVQGQVLREAELTFRLDGDVVHLVRVRALAGDRGVVEGGGYVLLGEDAQLALRLSGRDATVAGLLPAGVDIGELDLSVYGSLSNPLVAGRTRVSGLQALNPWLDTVNGRFLYVDGGVVLLDGEAAVRGGIVQIPYAFYDVRDPYVTALVRTSGFQLPATPVAGLGTATGVVSGRASVFGSPASLQSLAAFGVLDSTRVSAGPLDLAGITGPFAYADRMVYLPGMAASGLGGALQVAGRVDLGGRGLTDLVMQGRGVDMSTVAALSRQKLPFRFPGSGDVVATWQGGMGHRAWFSAQAEGAGYAAAGEGYLNPGGDLAAVVWTDHLPFDGRRLTGDLHLEGSLTAQAGLWGTPRDMEFAYTAWYHDSELTGLEGDLIASVGSGRWDAPQVRMNRSLATFEYRRPEGRPDMLAGLDGRVRPWWGPVMARPLETDPLAAPPLPNEAAVAFSGTWNLATKGYNVQYNAMNVDLAWLRSQPDLPEARRIAENLQITAGIASSSGTVFSDRGRPRLSRDTWFESPWFMAAGEGRRAEAYSAVGNVWIGPPEAGGLGKVHLDPVVVSRVPWDPDLPGPADLDRADPRALAQEDLFVVAGWLRGQDVDVRAWGQGWDVSEVLAFAPDAAGLPSDLLTGSLSVEGLRVSGKVTPDLMSSLAVTGRVRLEGGFLTLAGHPVPIQRASLEIDQRQNQLVLSDLSVDSGPLHLEGQGTRSASGRWLADLWTSELPFTYFHYLGRPWTNLEGVARMAVFLDSGPARPYAWLGLESENATWRTATGTVSFPELRLGRVRTAEDGGFRTGPGMGVRLGFSDLGFSLAAPPGAMSATATTEGQEEPTTLSASGEVAFGLPFGQTPLKWFAGPDGPDFGAGGELFRLEARNATANLLSVLAGRAPEPRRFTFSGAVSALGQWYAGHAVEAGPGRPDYRVEMTRLEVGEGPADAWSGLALQDTLRARYLREPQWGHLVVEPFEMAPVGPNPTGELVAQADMVLTRVPRVQDVPETRIEARGRDLDLSSLNFLIPGEQAGRIEELALTAVGPLLTPELQASLRLVDGRLGPLSIARMEGGVHGTRTEERGGYVLTFVGPNGPAELFFGTQPSPDQRVSLSGSVPVRWVREERFNGDRLVPVWAGRRLEGAGEMSLAAEMNDNQLRLVDELVPGVTSTSGTLRGSVELTGTLEKPELAGSLGVENGTIVHDLLGTLSGLNVRTRFEEIAPEEAAPTLGYLPSEGQVSRLTIEQFDGLLGGRPFTVAGQAEMLGVEPVNVDVALKGQALPLRWGGMLSSTSDVDLRLRALPGRLEGVEGTTLVPVVTGDVVVHQGDLEIPLSGLGGVGGEGAAPRLPVDYRINLALGEDVWVHLLGSRIRAQSDNLVIKPDSDTGLPVLAGEVELSRGVIAVPFYDVSFRVAEGRAVFEEDLIPTLVGVQAETEVGAYQVTAFVNGRYPDLRIDFVSNPPLAQSEITRLLAVGGLSPFVPGVGGPTGVGSAGAQSFAAGQGLSLVSQLLTTPISREIGRLLFLSDFSFEFYPPYSFAVKVAKALDDQDRFLLTLTRITRGGTGQDESLYGLEWRFQRNLLTRVAFDQYGQLRLWLQGIWDFD